MVFTILCIGNVYHYKLAWTIYISTRVTTPCSFLAGSL